MGFFDLFKRRDARPEQSTTSLQTVSPQTQGDEEYADFEEIDEALPLRLSSQDRKELDKIRSVTNVANNALGTVNKITDAYLESKRISANIEALKIATNAQVTVQVARINAVRETVTQVFAERQGALRGHYATLDKALQSNDRELIIRSLQGISDIVTDDPLKKVSRFAGVLSNPDPKKPIIIE